MRVVYVGGFTLMSNRGTPCHLMRAMARVVPTIYINPPHSYARWRKMRNYNFQNEPMMAVLTPVLPTSFRFLPWRIRSKLVTIFAIPQLLQVLKPLLSPPTILWSDLSELTLSLYKLVKPSLLCYHCLDDVSVWNPKRLPLQEALEAKADLIFADSLPLQQRYLQKGRHAILLRAGVDAVRFMKALDDATPIPKDLNELPSPRIGYVGSIHTFRVDISLMIELAKARPEWSIVLIGPMEKGLKIGGHLPSNLHFLGMRPYEDLPYYLKGLDVCLIPFLDTPAGRASNPLKLYEYLAAGRPVVSTPVPDLGDLRPFVEVACNVEEFVTTILKLLPSSRDPEAQKERAMAAAQHQWEHRAQAALGVIKEALQAKEVCIPECQIES